MPSLAELWRFGQGGVDQRDCACHVARDGLEPSLSKNGSGVLRYSRRGSGEGGGGRIVLSQRKLRLAQHCLKNGSRLGHSERCQVELVHDFLVSTLPQNRVSQLRSDEIGRVVQARSLTQFLFCTDHTAGLPDRLPGKNARASHT